MTCIEDLPNEVLDRIVSHLTLSNLLLLKDICSQWNSVITRQYLHRVQPSFSKELSNQGWALKNKDYNHDKNMFEKITSHLPNAWLSDTPTVTSHILGKYKNSTRSIVDCLTHLHKLYLCVEQVRDEAGSHPDEGFVEIWNQDDFSLMSVFENVGVDFLECRLALNGRTLIVSCHYGTKIRIFNADTDQMVREITSDLQPIYNFCISSNLLVCLSNWFLLVWKIDSSRPSSVEEDFSLIKRDYDFNGEDRSPVEHHTAVVNSKWLVTQTTKILQGAYFVIYLQVRPVRSNGDIGPMLRSERSSVSREKMFVFCMALAEDNDLLAMYKDDVVEGTTGYYVNVTKVESGEVLYSLPWGFSPQSYDSLRLKWMGSYLFIQLQYQECVALKRWDGVGGAKDVTCVGIKNRDKVLVERTRLVKISYNCLLVEDEDGTDVRGGGVFCNVLRDEANTENEESETVEGGDVNDVGGGEEENVEDEDYEHHQLEYEDWDQDEDNIGQNGELDDNHEVIVSLYDFWNTL